MTDEQINLAPGVYANFSFQCQRCGQTVTVTGGQEQTHECGGATTVVRPDTVTDPNGVQRIVHRAAMDSTGPIARRSEVSGEPMGEQVTEYPDLQPGRQPCEIDIAEVVCTGDLEITEIGGLKTWTIHAKANLLDLHNVRCAVIIRTGPVAMCGLAFVTDVHFDLNRKPMWISTITGEGPLEVHPPHRHAHPAAMDRAAVADLSAGMALKPAIDGPSAAVDGRTGSGAGSATPEAARGISGPPTDERPCNADLRNATSLAIALGDELPHDGPGCPCSRSGSHVVHRCVHGAEWHERREFRVLGPSTLPGAFIGDAVTAERDDLRRRIDAVRALCDEAEREEPDAVFSQGGPMWSIWTADVRKALDGEG